MRYNLCLLIFLLVFSLINCDITNNNQIFGTVAVPIANPPGGEYNNSQVVTLSTIPSDAIIYYTLDGSIPNINSNKYWRFRDYGGNG